MAPKPLPSPEVLRQLLRYEPETGRLFWLPRAGAMCASAGHQNRWNTLNAGNEAMASFDAHGYRCGRVMSVKMRAHRVIWAMAHNFWPPDQIDHINGDRTDNRLQNLRMATNAQNCRNMKLPKTNSSGVMGVGWYRPYGKWVASIRVSGKVKFLGYFSTITEAAAVRRLAQIEYGYDPGHGQR